MKGYRVTCRQAVTSPALGVTGGYEGEISIWLGVAAPWFLRPLATLPPGHR
jgi:hypothetical protein